MKRRRIRKIAIVLAVCFAFILPMSGRAAQFVDVNQQCSLTVYPWDPDSMGNQGSTGDQGDSGEGEQLQLELAYNQVAIDVYKVADAVANQGYDGYRYEMLAPYEGLQVDSDIDTDGWNALALEAVQIALGQGGSHVSVDAVATEELESGLYLLLARGKDLAEVEDYVVRSTRTVEGADGQQETEEYISGTLARSVGYVYTFTPVLVSIPSKDPDENGVISSANRSEWIYDMEVVLKPERRPRYGPLTIIKTLLSYETEGTEKPVTVVFDIEARMNGELVYSDVVAQTFTAAGQERIVIEDKIPVGATVTVTERYGGPSYVLDPNDVPEKTIVIRDADGGSVAFTNRYDDTDRGGHGITNNFVYEEIGGGILGWNWTQIPALGNTEPAGEGGE